MKYTHIMLGMILTVILAVMVLAIPVNAGIEDKYVPIQQFHPAPVGTVEFMLRAGGSAQDLVVFLKRAEDVMTFDPTYRYNDWYAETSPQNAGWLKIDIQKDGKSFPEVLVPGKYTACVRNGNGGQKECQDFPLNIGENKRVVFLGHAVSSGENELEPEPETECKPLQVTAGHIYGYLHNYQFRYRFDVHVTNPNDVYTVSHVEIRGRCGVLLLDTDLGANGNEVYTFHQNVDRMYRFSNPLSVSVGTTTCGGAWNG